MWMHETDHYVSYLLRLWKDDRDGESVWHASLESAQTHDLRYFANVKELADYLVAATKPPQSERRD